MIDNQYTDTFLIKKPDKLISDFDNQSFRYQLIHDTSFVISKDTISFEIYKYKYKSIEIEQFRAIPAISFAYSGRF